MGTDPTPEEIRQRRAEIHRERGEFSEAQNILDSPEYDNLFPAEAESDPKFRTIYEIGLPPRVASILERHGITWAGELALYTEERLSLIGKQFGATSIRQVKEALAGIGLSLKEPQPGEKALPPKLAKHPKPPKRTPRLSDRQVERIFELTASGNSQRTTAKLMRVCRWTVWNRIRLFKEKVRELYNMGANDSQVKSRLGDNRWEVWQRALLWMRIRAKGAA